MASAPDCVSKPQPGIMPQQRIRSAETDGHEMFGFSSHCACTYTLVYASNDRKKVILRFVK
jgi:hypothetical protein